MSPGVSSDRLSASSGQRRNSNGGGYIVDDGVSNQCNARMVSKHRSRWRPGPCSIVRGPGYCRRITVGRNKIDDSQDCCLLLERRKWTNSGLVIHACVREAAAAVHAHVANILRAGWATSETPFPALQAALAASRGADLVDRPRQPARSRVDVFDAWHGYVWVSTKRGQLCERVTYLESSSLLSSRNCDEVGRERGSRVFAATIEVEPAGRRACNLVYCGGMLYTSLKESERNARVQGGKLIESQSCAGEKSQKRRGTRFYVIRKVGPGTKYQQLKRRHDQEPINSAYRQSLLRSRTFCYR